MPFFVTPKRKSVSDIYSLIREFLIENFELKEEQARAQLNIWLKELMRQVTSRSSRVQASHLKMFKAGVNYLLDDWKNVSEELKRENGDMEIARALEKIHPRPVRRVLS